MRRVFAIKILTVLLLPVFLVIGCSDDKVSLPAQERPKAERLFDTPRSALEEAKEVAGSVELRNQKFREKAKETD